ncbi:CocE/NonD family hydrolase [Pseudomonas typographi]|uniref:CocE/NonD family hydrolase n=1 Tax=Pseudomonas typographi TaxID=2715964 RepID=A0ABR7Z460_9PSED|nr:CocE/NonD family hydrolase [Pseudomonas typographi]MBD1552720.1 CocE/NonD family hydrolase [Pseudomonas typographi]MBD1588201.1 CocE/NonD family hydrolase [Pseudomonas typographi]MBD1600172.1 CocE/NonD family hydrolase [Pseudomonas typographi]
MTLKPEPYQQICITLADGIVLTGRLWLPEGAAPAPLVLEWIPYRQSDNTAVGDSMLHGFFAQQGIAALRVDLRGSGNSQGLLHDEYLKQEQDDACEVIAWAAAQPWCNGKVGMIGISWGGFAALQVAARRPPALKAIVTCCSTDDRYSDDVHFMGGALLTDGLQWGTGLFTQLGRPADPAHVGQAWRELWLQRLRGLEPPLDAWLSHMERDAYWQHGSVCENYADIECAVYAVGGWTDGYSDAILRLMEHLPGPRKALIGPWTHVYPNWGTPGPGIDFLGECVRWWKHWLADEDTGVMAEPMLHLWQGEALRADASLPSIDGHWVTAPHWPPGSAERSLHLGDGRLLALPAGELPPQLIDSPSHCGLDGGEWCPLDGGGGAPEFQADQRGDDGLSLCFDSAPLQAPLTLFGKATLALDLAFDSPSALLVLRLNEVDPGGYSSRVTFAVHRIVRPPNVAAGERFRLKLAIKGVAYRFRPGHRLRLALSTRYWPMVWAEPGQGPVTVWPASSQLALPERPENCLASPTPFAAPRCAAPLEHQVLSPETTHREVRHDVGTGVHELRMANQRQSIELGGLTLTSSGNERYVIGRDAASAQMTAERKQGYRRDGWDIELRTFTRMGWRQGGLWLESRYEARENGVLVFERDWRQVFAPRHG